MAKILSTLSSRWQLAELSGKQLVLVKDFNHRIEPPLSLGEVIAVAIMSNAVAIFGRPTSETCPPVKDDLCLVIPAVAVKIEVLEDIFSTAAAAEIYHAFKLNRRHLLQLVVSNPGPDGSGAAPGKADGKEG